MAISTIRPGFLVSLKTSVKGNCRYDRVDIEREHVTPEGELEARWETQRTISDPAEYEAASKTRGKATTMIRGACAKSAFGLLCPEGNLDNLNRAIADAQREINAFNKNAALTRVEVYTIVGRIEPNDANAVKAIKSEISDLVAEMTKGVRNLDAKVIRDAATKARSVGQMLPTEAQERVKGAIAAARKAAKQIVKSGELAAGQIDKQVLKDLAEARTAFLDLDDNAVEIKVEAEAARTLDFEADVPPAEVVKPAPLVRQRLDV